MLKNTYGRWKKIKEYRGVWVYSNPLDELGYFITDDSVLQISSSPAREIDNAINEGFAVIDGMLLCVKEITL